MFLTSSTMIRAAIYSSYLANRTPALIYIFFSDNCTLFLRSNYFSFIYFKLVIMKLYRYQEIGTYMTFILNFTQMCLRQTIRNKTNKKMNVIDYNLLTGVIRIANTLELSSCPQKFFKRCYSFRGKI